MKSNIVLRSLLSCLLLLGFSETFAQEVSGPEQALKGPGGQDYLHSEVNQYDFADKADGFWLFEPAAPKPKQANVVVFLHGYGAYNPMVYGQWIKHLVRKGNTVIYPRYQKNLLSPSPKHFIENVLEGIHNALDTLRLKTHVDPIIDNLALVGHSYGGVLSANLAVHFKRYQIPQPKSVLLVSPGTGPFKGGLLKTYKDIPEETNLLVMVSDRDHVVGDKIGRLIYKTAEKVKNRNLIFQYSDYKDGASMTSGHNESYSVDKEFDSGARNATIKRALRISKVNAIDFYGYWKLFDALNTYTRTGGDPKFALGNTPEQKFLGNWSDGTKIKELEVYVPKESDQISQKSD